MPTLSLWDVAPAGSPGRPAPVSGCCGVTPAGGCSSLRRSVNDQQGPRATWACSPSAQRRSCLSSQLKDPLSEKGTCHPVPVTGGVNVNGWRWEWAMTSAAAWGTFPRGLSCFLSHWTEARCQLEFLVLSHGRAQPSPSVASLVSISRVPLRCPGVCQGLLLLVRGALGYQNLLSRQGQAAVWCHTSCTCDAAAEVWAGP